jgi:hypothetical protein
MAVYQVNTKFKDYPDKELIKLVQSLHESIYVTDCFGTNDLRYYESISKELENRGYHLNEANKLEITKGGEHL